MRDVEWSPTIGDPSLMGWITVIAYFFTTAIAFKIYLSSARLFSGDVAKMQKRFWLIVALAMLFLGINKQLDLQSLFTAIGKYYAHRDGWYQQRRFFQVSAISGLIIFMILLMFLFMLQIKSILRTNWLAVIGLFFLLVFISIRATSFHHMDTLINTYFVGIKANWFLELSGIATIAFSGISINCKQKSNRLRKSQTL